MRLLFCGNNTTRVSRGAAFRNKSSLPFGPKDERFVVVCVTTAVGGNSLREVHRSAVRKRNFDSVSHKNGVNGFAALTKKSD